MRVLCNLVAFFIQTGLRVGGIGEVEQQDLPTARRTIQQRELAIGGALTGIGLTVFRGRANS